MRACSLGYSLAYAISSVVPPVKSSPQQAGLFDEVDLDVVDKNDTIASHTRKTQVLCQYSRGLTPPEEIVHDLVDADNACPNSSCENYALKPIGDDACRSILSLSVL